MNRKMVLLEQNHSCCIHHRLEPLLGKPDVNESEEPSAEPEPELHVVPVAERRQCTCKGLLQLPDERP